MNKLLSKYKDLPVPLKASLWFAVCHILNKGISVITTPFFTRLLPIEEYGLTGVYASWSSIFALVVTLSSGHAALNLCTKMENKGRLLSSITGLNLFLVSAWGVFFFFLFDKLALITGLSKTLLLCLFLSSAFQSFIKSWNDIRIYQYSYKMVVAESVLYYSMATFGALFLVVLVSKTAEAKIIPEAIAAVMIGSVIIIRALSRERTFYDATVWTFTLGFCVPQIPHYLSEVILINSDRIMIDRMCGQSEVAIYSVAYSVGSLINMVTGSINSAFAPYQYQKLKAQDYKTLAKNTDYIIAFIAVCLCGFMLFGREIVLIFGGSKYIESISLIIPISLGAFFNYVFQLFARVQEYYEQKFSIVIASMSCAALNVLLNAIFIRKYGYAAAAYTTFFCYFVFCFLHYAFYRIACKKNVGKEIYDIRGLLIISAILLCAAVVIRLISKYYILKYAVVASMVALILWKKDRIIVFARSIRSKE